jgi:plasmid stability protein
MTSLELPEALVAQIQSRAAHEGRKVEDFVADLLSASPPEVRSDTPQLVAKSLPLLKVRPVQPAAGRQLGTQEWCEWIREFDLQLDVERYEKGLGHQYVDRADG